MKEMEELYREMLAEFQRLTGTAMTGESDLAVRLYAVAAQVHALYVQSDWVTRQCFPQTATGEWLDQHAQLRGGERRGGGGGRRRGDHPFFPGGRRRDRCAHPGRDGVYDGGIDPF